MPFAVDLFSGLGGASAAMVDRGWRVVRVDFEPAFRPSVVGDVCRLPLRPGLRPDLVWASPPCDEFSRSAMPWHRDQPEPSLALVEASIAAVALLEPRFWIVENVKGSLPYLRPVLGPHVLRLGSVYLWGRFPLPLLASPAPYGLKHMKSSRADAERARIPYAISEAVAIAVESSDGR